MAVPAVGRRRVQGALTALNRSVLAGPTLEAARHLLGARLVRAADPGAEPRIGRIVEVEAYIGTDDLASHARFGRTARNTVMFGPPGRAYVYLVYGMYDCLNVVTEPDGRPAAVLIRAVEPIAGVGAIRRARIERALLRRAAATPAGAAAAEARIATLRASALCAGPALVATGFSLTRADTGVDLLDPGSPVRIEAPAPSDRAVELRSGPRVGIDYAPEPWRSRPWRLWDASSPAVSGDLARRTRR